MKTNILVAFAAISVLGTTTQAGVVTGKLWQVPDPDTYIANPSALPAATPDVEFDSPTPFNYSLEGTVGDWLATGGAFNIVENTAGTLAALMSAGSAGDGSIIELTGCISVLTGTDFTFTHDDGMYLEIGGMDLGFLASPTSPYTETQTYTGPSGTFPFQLVYTENNSGPAVLIGGSSAFDTCIATPDSGNSIAMIGGVMAALGLAARRIRR